MAIPTLRYDLRRAPFAGTSHPERYEAALAQCAWADERGFSSVVLSEHHGVEDGFLPAPLVFAAAVAGRTSRVLITISALIVPLHDPLRLAEEMAVLDLASGGRIAIVAGIGYRAEEFEMFGVDKSRRGAILEEHIDVLRKAWTGEPFEYEGRTVRVTPAPVQQPHPTVFIGGSTEVAAKRAARLRLPFFPGVGDPALQETYDAECARLGFDGGFTVLPKGPGFVHVTDDPDKAWAEIAPYALYDATTYASWQPRGQRSQVTTDATTADELRASGVYAVVTPDECVALAKELGPTGGLVLHPLMGGMPPELGWQSLELFASKVLPKLG
jgi:alkanesulfonate monooxygenase SsuD/methylene tetrahydromethanopterin reductase-like flavin-dependent oxidoreductase (luciferase family)